MAGKNRTREYVHDRLYLLADKMLKRHNPCHKCIVHNCFNETPQRCCEGCPHFNNGCTVQALYCKLWLCDRIRNRKLRARLQSLYRIAKKYDLLVVRASREETLEFGEQLADDEWWIYYADFHKTREQIHKWLREGPYRG